MNNADMITRSAPRWQGPDWQAAMRDMVRDPDELFRLLELDPAWLPAARRAGELFPLRVSRHYLGNMEPGNSHDPLLRQVLPLEAEHETVAGYSEDPLAESEANPLPGVIHKYRGRVLLIVTSACAVHCRYCFRRHFPYGENNPSRSEWQRSLDYIRADPSISEVILSGGDPLNVGDDYLGWLIEAIAGIEHVERLRLHTRLPLLIPQRLTERLVSLLTTTRLAPVVVVHANHANELCDTVAAALKPLRDAGVTLLNQSVLLRGVNDDADTLAALSERLFRLGVLPYYLHLLDYVEGAAHFAIDDEHAQHLYAELLARLSGYMVPRLVREVPGLANKWPLAPLAATATRNPD